ncbi:hypothetical protein QJQ45_026390 [Haematococcus lacustris]|nr:hypothetical protein QJQ45_026390 [Haematococcus lacustris]
MSSSQEQQVGGAWSVSLDFRCGQLEHDRCSMARRRAAANKEVARSQQGMTWSKTVSGRPLDMSGPQCPA